MECRSVVAVFSYDTEVDRIRRNKIRYHAGEYESGDDAHSCLRSVYVDVSGVFDKARKKLRRQRKHR